MSKAATLTNSNPRDLIPGDIVRFAEPHAIKDGSKFTDFMYLRKGRKARFVAVGGRDTTEYRIGQWKSLSFKRVDFGNCTTCGARMQWFMETADGVVSKCSRLEHHDVLAAIRPTPARTN